MTGVTSSRAGALLGVAAAVFAILLALPGATVTTVYVNDLFIFLDGAHRVTSGQVPNRDFHTALGPLTSYLPAAGYWVSGTLGGAMPTGMALAVVATAPVMAHVLTSRLQPLLAAAFGLFLLLILAVPANLGESIASLSFAMFYNRIGWGALGVLLVMYLPPVQRRRHQDALDAACAAFLTLAMLFTKVTYGAVALAFLAFMLLDRDQRRWAAGAMVATAGGAAFIEALWQSAAAHLADLALAAQVSGARPLADLLQAFLRHLADYVLFAILAVLASWQRRSLRDLLFFGFCAGPGLIIMNQNSQPWGIITLHAGAAVAAEMLQRRGPAGQSKAGARQLRIHSGLPAGAPLVLLALIMPTAVHCALTLGLHAGLAASRSGDAFGLPAMDRIRLASLWSPGDHQFSAAYLASIRDGAQLLATLPVKPVRVSVLDFANPFSAGLSLPPPTGDNAWLHWGRNVNAAHFLPAEQLLGGVDVLMAPKWGINPDPLRDLYGAYVDAAFEPLATTDHWTVYRRRGPARMASASASSQREGNGRSHPVLEPGNGKLR